MVIEDIDVGYCACEMRYAACLVFDPGRIGEPALPFIVYNETCPDHPAQWRWDYLAWEGELPA